MFIWVIKDHPSSWQIAKVIGFFVNQLPCIQLSRSEIFAPLMAFFYFLARAWFKAAFERLEVIWSRVRVLISLIFEHLLKISKTEIGGAIETKYQYSILVRDSDFPLLSHSLTLVPEQKSNIHVTSRFNSLVRSSARFLIINCFSTVYKKALRVRCTGVNIRGHL